MSKGIFHVKVIEATDIPKMDLFGKADPYCILKFNDKQKYRTKTIENTYKPVWNEEFHFEINNIMTDYLAILMKDEDRGKSDDPISKLVLHLCDFEQNTVIEKWFNAVPVKGVKKGGRIRLKLHISTNGSPAFVESSATGPTTSVMSGLAGNMQIFSQNVVQMARKQQNEEKKLEQQKQGFYNSPEMQQAQMPPEMVQQQQMQMQNGQQQVQMMQQQPQVQVQAQQQPQMGMMQTPSNMNIPQQYQQPNGMMQQLQIQPQYGMMNQQIPQQQQQPMGMMQNPQMGMMQMPQTQPAPVGYVPQSIGMMGALPRPQYGMMNPQMVQQPQYGMMMGAQSSPYGMMPQQQQPGMMMAPQTNTPYMQPAPQYPGQMAQQQMYPGQMAQPRRY